MRSKPGHSRVGLVERFGQEDKQKHLWYSFFILLVASFVFPLAAAVLVTFLTGVAKEVWDHYRGSGFCWYDMAANGAGMVLALACQQLFTLLMIAGQE
ncbi:MAG: hypothetical protein CSB48_09705 [Proteobacteria bacterium]|nr:MAG: hypothetical protein CSB48_09705 [Pseudomonadota bacterium]